MFNYYALYFSSFASAANNCWNSNVCNLGEVNYSRELQMKALYIVNTNFHYHIILIFTNGFNRKVARLHARTLARSHLHWFNERCNIGM